MAWDEAKMIMKEPHQGKRWFKESLCIKAKPLCFAKVTHPISHYWVDGLKDQIKWGSQQ